MEQIFGLLNLYESKNPVVDIVFVHGLNGHRISTWSIKDDAVEASLLQSTETGEHDRMGSPEPFHSLQLKKRTSSGFSAKRQLCWPRDLLPRDVDDCRILSWGYDAMSVSSSSHLRFDDHAKNLLQDLTLARYKESEVRRPIIFVAHSLGGIVVKSAISKSYLEVVPRSRAISAATRGVLFLGTPHRGLSQESFMDILRKIQSTNKLSRTIKDTSKELSEYSVALDRINKSFEDALQDVSKIFSVYETVGSLGLGIIVDSRSVVLGLPHETTYALDADHMNLCKFKSIHDHGYMFMSNEIRQIIDEISTKNKARMNSCLESLKVPESMEDSWKVSQKSRFPKTCEWVLEHPDYLKWARGPESKVLLVTGPAGSGKSTLVGYVLSELRNHRVQNARTIQLYFFCSFKARHTPTVIIRSLLRQLINQNIPGLYQVLEVRSLSVDSFWRDFAKLWELFTYMIGELGEYTVYCILDAIDEIAEDNALTFVQAISSEWSPASSVNIKVIASARRDSKFISILSASPRTIALDLALLENQELVKRDIATMLSQSVGQIPAISSEESAYVTQKLTELSHGSFLVSKLHSEHYREFTVKNIRVLIDQAQGGITSAFDAVVDSIVKGSRQTITQQALIWLVTAERPLTFNELDWGLRDQNTVSDSFMSRSFLESVLGPLLGSTGEPTGERVTLCHQSVELYLKQTATRSQSQVSPFQYDSSERNGILAKSCVRLLLQIVTYGPSLANQSDSLDLTRFIDDHGFARYAVTHCMDHLRSVKRWESSDWRSTEMLFEQKQTLRAWLQLLSKPTPLRIGVIDNINMDPLEIATYFHLSEVVRRLLETSQRTMDRRNYSGALHIAAEIGNVEICQLLLEHGAEPRSRIGGLSVLQVAVKGQHKDIIGILIDHRLDIEDTDTLGQTVLHLACQSGSVEIVRMLLDIGADINKKSGLGLAPLHYAVEAGHGNVIKQLLDRGAEFDILNRQEESLLHIAARNNNAALVQLFLSKGSDVNFQMPEKMTPLHVAARGNSAHIVSVLLIAGADPHCQTKTGSTPLHEAAISGAVDCARALVVGKASLDKQDHTGRLPLHLAAEQGHKEMVALLLDHLGQENSTKALTVCGRTALHHATQSSGCVSVVELLVCHYDFDPNVKDFLGLTPLHEAVRYLKSAVELLLDYGGNPTVEDLDERSPIAFAVSMSSYDTLKLLLDASELDENTRGSCVLQDALSRGQEDIIQLLVADRLPWVACGKFEYLLDLRDLGYKSEELVGFLLDVQDSSPWISPEGWGEQFTGYKSEVKCDFHQPSCAHTCVLDTQLEILKDSQNRPRWARRYEEMIAMPGRMETMRNTICALCGIGSVLPPQDTTAPSKEIEFSNGGAIITYDVRITTNDVPRIGRETPEFGSKDIISRPTCSSPPRKELLNSSSDLLYEPDCGFRAPSTTKVTPTEVPSSVISRASQLLLIVHLNSIMLRVQEAINVLQTEGFCCDSFTVMSCSDDVCVPRSDPDEHDWLPVIAINTISFSSIVKLAVAIERASLNEDAQNVDWRDIAELSLDILKKIQGQNKNASIWASCSTETLLDQVHLCSLAIQSICTGLASYAHAHAGKYHPSFLETPSSFILLRGLSVDRPAVIVELRQLKCMGDVIANEVLVFRFHRSGWAVQTCGNILQASLLLASAENIADTWGATLFVSNNSAEAKDNLVGIDINGGTIKNKKGLVTSTGAALYHWYPYPSEYDNDKSFAAGEQILIGIIRVNENCPLNEVLSRQASENQLIELGTADPMWQTSQRQLALQGGQYFTAQAGLTQSKLPHIPVKDTIFQHWAKDFDLEVLGEPWGLHVSLCTGVAKRVQLKNLLGCKSVLAFLDNHHTLFEDWQAVREKATRGLVEELSLEGFHNWIQNLSKREQKCVTRVIDYILDKLRNTGVDRTGEYLAVWWPQPYNPRQGVRINAIKGRSWFHMLHESPTCAVFAAITTECFENEDHPCRQCEVARWMGGGSMLQTAVHLDESGTCRPPRIQPQLPWRLEDGQTYWINKHAKYWVKVFKSRQSATTELEVKFSPLPFKLFTIVKDGILRERHTIHTEAEEVVVKWPTRKKLQKQSAIQN